MVESVRPWWGRVLTIVIASISAAVTIWTGVGYSWADAARAAPWMALLTLACWATFWRPCVTVSDAGVELVNVSRTIFIPWPALHDIDTKWSLRLTTAYGRFTAWSASAPGARGALLSRSSGDEYGPPAQRGEPAAVRASDLADSPSGSAAALIRQRWDKIRAAGHLDDPRLERERAQVTWHVATALAAVLLLAVGLATAI